MKKIGIFCLILSLIAVFFLPVSATQTTSPTDPTVQTTAPTQPAVEDISVTQGCRTIEGQVPLYKGQTISAAGAMLYETNSQTIVFAKNPDEPFSPAGLVKVMTLLLAVEKGNLSDTVSVTATALDSLPAGTLTVKLQVGELLTMEQLLHCMMAGSANDAAVVVAEYLSGAPELFVMEMNERALELGCTSTNFTNVHGLNDKNQYTTARDMCRILAAAVQNPDFMTFFGTKEYTVAATNLSRERNLVTTNYIMVPKYTFYHKFVTGGRTGIDDDNGRCLASSAQGNGMSYVAVVLGSEPEYHDDGYTISRYGNYEDSKLLYDLGFENLRYFQLLSDKQILDQYPVAGGNNHVAVGTDRSLYMVVPGQMGIKDFTMKFSNPVDNLSAPIDLGETVSVIELWYNNSCVAVANLVARNAVPLSDGYLVPHWIVEDEDPDFLMMAAATLFLAVVFAAAAGALYLVRKVQDRFMRRPKGHKRNGNKRS